MNRTVRDNHEMPVLLGGLLVLVGLAALVLQQADVRFGDFIGEVGWPLFVIAPGIVLLVAAFITPRPSGIGFAIAGSIVTTVGLILLYQNTTGAWESWAYVWTLIPGAAGVALVVYGSVIGSAQLVNRGTRMAIIAAVLFVAGLWFFGPVFSEGRVPVELDQWWPFALVAVGVAIVVSAVLGSRSGGSGSRDTDEGHTA